MGLKVLIDDAWKQRFYYSYRELPWALNMYMAIKMAAELQRRGVVWADSEQGEAYDGRLRASAFAAYEAHMNSAR